MKKPTKKIPCRICNGMGYHKLSCPEVKVMLVQMDKKNGYPYRGKINPDTEP